MKIKFDTDNKLPLNKQLKLHMLTILVRYVFEEGDKLYPQLYLDDCFYRLWKCYNTKKLMFLKELTLIKHVYQKNVCFVIIGILKMLDVNLNHMFVITHPATRRRGDVVTKSLCTSQRRRSYVLNETPNDVSMERR